MGCLVNREADFFRHPLWTPALAVFVLLLNVYVAWPLFVTEYVPHMFSIEAAYIALTRYAMENWGALTWFPLWNAGMPYQNAYQPGLPIVSAALGKLLAMSPALAYHFTIGLFYCAGPVGIFFLVSRMTGRRDAGVLAALFYSLLSPSAFLSSTVRGDLGSLWYARRYQALIFYGEGPNVSGLNLVPFGLWGVHAVYSRVTALRFTLAALALGSVILVSWPSGVAMSLGVLAYLLSRDWAEAGKRIWILAVLALTAYALVAPWDPPSTIRDNQRNSQLIGGPYHYHAKHFLYFGLLALATVGIRLVLRRAGASPFLQFSAFWTLFMGAVALSALWWKIALLPQPERFHLAMEIGACFLLACAFLAIGQYRQRIYYAALIGLLCVSFFQVKRYRRFADKETRAFDVTGTIEYQTSRWFAEHMPGQRIYAAGSTAFWMNVWSDTPQVTGCCLPGMPNPMSWTVGYIVPSGDGAGGHDAEIALLWMRAFGAQAVAVGGPGTRDSYRDWVRGNKFEGVLPKLRESGGDRIYGIPSRTTSLAHVVESAEVVSRAPLNGIDVEPLRPFVRALEDPARPLADWKWIGRAEAKIAAQLQPQQSVSVQVTYSPGWHARAGGQDVPIARDALGLMTINPKCAGACEISMWFDGGVEAKLLRVISLLTQAGLAGWLLFSVYRGSRRTNSRGSGLPLS